MHTSVQTRQRWIKELLEGHPQHFQRAMGMSKFVFKKLIHALTMHCDLRATRHVSVEEQVCIFLLIAVTEIGNHEHQDRFQRSKETISKYVIMALYFTAH
ncbi:unnamed protein product [Mycena citricolor]|uniref:DUF8040 domain-containing protein n=1 Tax=Mycena citricolor TaxID=2018698 RepID=A0AAD2HBD9_9AGAR|nr:unnamed protein product [Mycena citricolor]